MGTYSSKFFDVKKTNDYFSDVYSEFEAYKTNAQAHVSAINDFATSDEWKGIDAEAGKTLLSVDVTNVLNSITEAQDKIVDIQENILTTFAADVDSASNAKIRVSTLETIKNDFGTYYDSLDYLATQAENCSVYFKNDYGKYGAFSDVDLATSRTDFKSFSGESASDESGFLYECIQKMLNFDANGLSYLQEQHLVSLIYNIGKSMGFTYTKDDNKTDYKRRIMGEINGKVYYYDSPKSSKDVAATQSKSEPSWIAKSGGWVVAFISGDLSYKNYSEHGIDMRKGDEKRNGWRTDYVVKKRELKSSLFKGKGTKAGPFEAWNKKFPKQRKEGFWYVKDKKDNVHKGKGKLGQDENGNETSKKKYAKNKFDRELYEVASVGVSGSKECSVADLYGKKGGENTYIEGEAKFLTGEIHGGVNAGLYRYETTADGKPKKVFSPAVKAEVGASAAAFEGTANARAGSDKLGVYANGKVRALSAEGTAGVTVNKSEVHARAAAEADLAKASGSVGTEIAGAKVGVNGSVKVGIGAHADVGISHGVVKCEIGAAVGIGVDVGFEVDAGGLVNAAGDACKSAWDGATDLASDAKDLWDSIW